MGQGARAVAERGGVVLERERERERKTERKRNLVLEVTKSYNFECVAGTGRYDICMLFISRG